MSQPQANNPPGVTSSSRPRQGTKSSRPLPGAAATRSYNVASVWETSAALTESQLRLVEQISSCCSVRPIPAHVVDDQGFTTNVNDSNASKDAYVGTLEDAVLHNANQFHKWHSELEAACASEMEEKYKRYADLLNSHLQTCESILSKVDNTVVMFDTLLTQHKDVNQKSKNLRSSCEQLVREKEQLVEFADAIRTKLKFFDEFETVSAQFQKAQLSLDHEQYLQLMKRLDDGLAYVATNPQYADASTYIMKFKQLQSKALGAVRSKVQQVLKQASQQVQTAIQESLPKAAAPGAPAPVLPEGAEVPLLYVRFRAAAEPSLKGLIREMEARSARIEYQRLLQECQNLYGTCRQQLLTPVLQARLSASLAGQPLPTITRTGCEALLRVCQMEWQLFEQLFPGCKSPLEALSALTEPLCMLLYDVLRPQVVVQQDINELCELVDVLKHEVMGDQISKRGAAAEALKPMLDRVLSDVQGRIIFRAQAFIKETVAGYVPSADDVDYPAKLDQQVPGQQAGDNGHADTDNGQDVEATPAIEAPPAAPAGKQVLSDPYSLLYPPLRSTLLCLSKLYRALDTRTFGGLAQEAVSACTLSIQHASRQVARKSGPLDAQLFMIKHLLFLREQIAPFDVDFAVTDIDLDFTHMREHMRRIMAGESSLFALGSNNAVVKMLGGAGPRVLTYQVDSKKELEKQLKGVCEAFIMAVTKVAVEPMLSFITKVTAVRVAAQAQAPKVQPLREQAFASPAKVAEMAVKVNEALTGPLPAAINKMRAFLPNPATHAILFKPVKSNIAEAHAQVCNLLAAEYTPEEVATVPLKQPQELAAMLDALC